jgi:hypothetical protein
MLAPREPVRADAVRRPVLVVVVDTEEEFEWERVFDPAATSVRALASIGRFQDICDERGIRPCYVVDHPVATQPDGIGPLRAFVDAGRAEIGAHLHPWVNPPCEEEMCAAHSYPGNLPSDLEARKLRALSAAIEQAFGAPPRVYKAGRYGLGPRTARLLEELGFEVDCSVCARADLSPDSGPDFTGFSSAPFWFGEGRRLLELPVTADWVGWLRFAGPWLRRLPGSPWARRARLPGLLSRARAFERLRLSPEGMVTDQHRRLTKSLLRRGTRILTFSFHSPSVEPGCTPYVRDAMDLQRFLDACRAYFDFFLGDVGGVTMTPLEVKRMLEAGRAA